ncbi:MAG TPA: hypothetical protein VFZ65_23730 [Planctomycetota bacterium]|nr:hypothetical protein [Planctomycetota bacterium]
MNRTSLSLLVATAGIPAQSVLTVGPGAYPDIGAAVAAASPGDIIEVATGTYPAFQVDKGVTIRGAFDATGAAPAWVIPAGQVLHVVGGGFDQVTLAGGRATFDGTLFTTCFATPLLVDHATAHLQDCYLSSCFNSYPTLRVVAADVTMVLTRFIATSGIVVAPLIQLDGSRLHASRCLLSYNNYPCVSAVNGATAWISDTTINQQAFGCALQTVGSTIRTDRLQFTGAAQGGCPTGTPGTLLGVDRPQPIQPGGSFTLQYLSAPNDFVVVFASPFLGTVDWSPFLEQPSWLDDQSAFAVTVLVADSLGRANAAWSIPGNPAFANLTLWFKGVGGFAGWPLQASPVVGGVVR